MLMLDQRDRQWANIITTLAQHLALAVVAFSHYNTIHSLDIAQMCGQLQKRRI